MRSTCWYFVITVLATLRTDAAFLKGRQTKVDMAEEPEEEGEPKHTGGVLDVLTTANKGVDNIGENVFKGGKEMGAELKEAATAHERIKKAAKDQATKIVSRAKNITENAVLGMRRLRNANRMHAVEDPDPSIKDFETRQKPPFVSIPGKADKEHLTSQQQEGMKGIFDTRPDDFRDCMLIHQYAQPLQVVDSYRFAESVEAKLRKNDDDEDEDEEEGNKTKEPVLVRPGAMYDGTTADGKEMHVSTTMFANLDGITNPVQVIAHGSIARWSSKNKVPIAGFLCMPQGYSDSSPVLSALPTPCVPTSLDEVGNPLDPTLDGFEVWIASTRLTFASKDEAETFCEGFAETIASDLKTTIWDLEQIRAVNISGVGTPTIATPQSSVPVTGEPAANETKLPPENPDVGVMALARARSSLTRSPSLMNFVQQTAVRNTPGGWTKGKKSLLVVITDWKEGDNSLAPYSKQEAHPIGKYTEKIFPRVRDALHEMSYGQFDIEYTIVPEVIRYARNRNQVESKYPFPALYESARTSLQGHPTLGQQFAFRNYDLVYVIHPQTNPVGTKGLSWVGSRGAICNGCETLSDNFKVMVAVHEIGHNLGLHHASSDFLEYGNPFDFMGNYPDTLGLNFGVGYKYQLGWIPATNIFEVSDGTLGQLNDVITLSPFDTVTAPSPQQIVGIRISLSGNPDDYYLSYRSTTNAKNRGLFITHQDKGSPNSKLVDCACHSVSQQDAHLRKGWTFLDASEQVVVVVTEESAYHLKVHLYATPNDDPAPIRARPGFTDGVSKCPVTCQDSDLLVSKSCSWMKQQGYCAAGSVQIQGKKMSIGQEVCPETCGRCEDVFKSTPLEVGEAACMDKNVKISGMDCKALAAKDMCEMKTTSGIEVGRDLCPSSCGKCQIITPAAGSGGPDPAPAREVGLVCPADCAAPAVQAGSANNGGKALLNGQTCVNIASPAWGGVRYCGSGKLYSVAGSINCRGCQPAQCPAQCQSPSCVAGGRDNGGTVLQGNACTNRCSANYGGKRYCGAGLSYSGDGTIDCSGCWGSSAMLFAHPIAFRRKHHARNDEDTKEQELEGEGEEIKGIDDKPEYSVVGTGAAPPEGQQTPCEDDHTWRDPYGDSCKTYARTIKLWGRDKACKEHWSGLAMQHCRATCGSCKKGAPLEDYSPACVDNACISPWQKRDGRCSACIDFPKGCTDPRYKSFFVNECPVTCGTCKAPNITVSPEAEKEEKEKPESICEDTDKKWCMELGSSYCSEEAFSKRCHKTCELCTPEGTVSAGCTDKFSAYTCSRYASYGWCDRQDTRDAVRLQCKMTCGECTLFPLFNFNHSNVFGKRSSSHRSTSTGQVTVIFLLFVTCLGHLFQL